jgi:hypothetical protein
VSLDRRQSPRLLVEGGDWPVFGPGQDVMFRSLEGQSNFLDRINRDGTGRARVLASPITDLVAASPDGEWVTVQVSEKAPGMPTNHVAVRIQDGAMHALCQVFCMTYWSVDGKYLAMAMTPLRTAHTGSAVSCRQAFALPGRRFASRAPGRAPPASATERPDIPCRSSAPRRISSPKATTCGICSAFPFDKEPSAK